MATMTDTVETTVFEAWELEHRAIRNRWFPPSDYPRGRGTKAPILTLLSGSSLHRDTEGEEEQEQEGRG